MRISEDVMEILSELDFDNEANLVKRIKAQLTRPMYEKVNKVLELLGGKWNRKANGHVFPSQSPGTIEELISGVIMTGEVVDKKRVFDFFETPATVADLLVERACFDGKILRVLEPSAGRGAIIEAIRREPKADKCLIQCCEIQEENVRVLIQKGHTPLASDFLNWNWPLQDKANLYDRILMNPPFSKYREVHHVMHAYKFLRPGGKLIAVMSAGVEFRKEVAYSGMTNLIHKTKGEIDRLPEGSFSESGTNVNTVMVTLRK